LTRTETTDERMQTMATDYDQFGPNNSVGRVRERDYNNAVLRTTINEYLSYIDNDVQLILDPNHGGLGSRHRPRRINLLKSTKVFEGEDLTKLAAFTVNAYDDYPQPLQSYAADPLFATDVIFGGPRAPAGIVQHSTPWNPSSVTDYITLRGNVTSVTRYADTSNAASPASPIVQTTKYDMAGNVISASTLCCEATTTTFEFATQYGFPSTQTRGASDTNSLLRVTTTSTFDTATGLIRFMTDANNRTIETTYYPESLRTKEIVAPTGARVKFEYFDDLMKVTETTRLSDNGTITSQRTKYFNGLGSIVKEEALGAGGVIDVVDTVYDNFGRLSKQSLAYRSGQTIQWRENVYDAAGRLAQQREPALPLFFKDGPEYPKTQYFYNEATRPLGASTEPGQTTRTVDAWDRWRWARVDSAGRLVEVIEPAPGGGTGLQTKYTYNALNKLVKTEQGNQVRRFRYDSLGRLTHQKLAEAEATLNLAGQWTTAGTANDRWSDVFTYDERSNLVSRKDARGVKTTFKYKDTNNVDDPLNRLQSISYDLSDVPGTLTVLPAATITYQYRSKTVVTDAIDVTQVRQIDTAGVSSEVLVYDTEGRLQEKQFTFNGRPHSMKTTYSYDAASRINQVTYPEQYRDNILNPIRKAVVPSYDAASRINGLKVNTVDYASQVTYNAANQITSALIGTGPNQVTETYTYDPLTELMSGQTVKRGATTLLDYSYGYKLGYCDNPLAICSGDPIFEFHTGQLTLVTNNGPSTAWKRQYYQYDELSRLKSAHQYTWIQQPKPPNGNFQWEQKTHWLQNYSYDRFGNRTTVAASNNTGLPVAQDGYQSLSFEETSNRITTAGFQYDFAGNQLQNNTGQSFVYDAAGRLVTVKNGATTVATYTYGSSNKRLITQTGTESSTDKTYYVWEGNSVIAEYVEQTSATMPKWSKNYVYLGNRLLASESPNGGAEIVHYHHPDRLSTALVTNNVDTTSFTQTNLPFGTALDPGAPEVTKRRFTSYDRSATTGLDYAINRHYDPRQGRFTQPDPIGMAAVSLADPQSLNMYSYVGNDPVNRVDPDGQFWGALFRFIAGLFRSLRPNVITGSFTFRNSPPIFVAFTPDLQNIGIGFAGIGFALRSEGHWLPDVLGLSKQLNAHADSASYTGPCPPTSDVIHKSAVLTEAVREAQKQANLARDTGTTPGWIEHGGWILWKIGTRNVFKYLIKEPRHSRNSPAGYEFLDSGYRVWLHEPPAPPKGWEWIAIFHLHNGDVGPHDGDTTAADAVKVPGFVGETDGKIWPVGTFKRGVVNKNLPERCR
jgi:RHS repeat-associated protein